MATATDVGINLGESNPTLPTRASVQYCYIHTTAFCSSQQYCTHADRHPPSNYNNNFIIIIINLTSIINNYIMKRYGVLRWLVEATDSISRNDTSFEVSERGEV